MLGKFVGLVDRVVLRLLIYLGLRIIVVKLLKVVLG